MKKFETEFDKFLNMLKNEENFAFSRFSDGEIFILQNKILVLGSTFFITGEQAGHNIYTEEERKEFLPERDQLMRLELEKSWKHKQHNYFKGIPSSKDIHVTLEGIELNKSDMDQYTFANVFINGNYAKYVKEIVNGVFPARNIIYVAHKNADVSKLPFKVSKHYKIGNDCFRNDVHIVNTMLNDFNKETPVSGTIVLCSAASLSNIIIHRLYEKFPQFTYLDIGSTLNPFLGQNMSGWQHTRDYLRTYWKNEKTYYGEQIDEWFEET